MNTLGLPEFEPARPLAEVLAEARHATPPDQPADLSEPDLVSLIEAVPLLRLGPRAAANDDFTDLGYHTLRHAWAQRVLAEPLARVAQALAARNIGLVVHDAYRPWQVTYAFWHLVPDTLHDYVANPQRGSMHNRGLAVDLSLCELDTGKPHAMPSMVDEFTPRAHLDCQDLPEEALRNRAIIQDAMTAEGFEPLDSEWWHFAWRCDPLYPVMNTPLDQLGVTPAPAIEYLQN